MPKIAWIVLALLPQDAEVARQAARITAKDPRASFDAVSRLTDLAATSRAAVEAAASKLPDDLAFYRTALLEELKARERAPRLKRATFDAKDAAPLGLLNEIASKYGEKLEFKDRNRPAVGPAAPATITLRLENVSYTEALDAVCREAKVGLFVNGTLLSINPVQENLGSFPYRNYLVLLPSATRSRKIEFGAGETRSIRLALTLFWDSDGDVVRIVKASLAEAVDSNGKPVDIFPEKPPPPEPARKEGDPVVNSVNWWKQCEIALKVPDAEKISRVRGFTEVLAPREASAFEFSDLAKDEKKSDDHFEVETLREAPGVKAQFVVRVTPKGSMEAFIKSAVEFRVWFADGAEHLLYAQGRLSEGRVEYPFGGTETRLENSQIHKSLKVRIHRALVERRIPFEFTDIPVK